MAKQGKGWRTTEPFMPSVAWHSGYMTAHGTRPRCIICGTLITRDGRYGQKSSKAGQQRPVIWLGPMPDEGKGIPAIAHLDCALGWAKKVLEHNKGVKVS